MEFAIPGDVFLLDKGFLIMYPLILEHLTSHDLPAEWALLIPSDLMFSVVIVTNCA